jgi:hypothetical protein
VLSAFYTAFSQACFGLLGLWWAVVQFKHGRDGWLADPVKRRTAYSVSLFFLIPGAMAMFALIAEDEPIIWRAGFFIASIIGVVEAVNMLRRPIAARSGKALMTVNLVLYALLAIGAIVPVTSITLEALLGTVLVLVGTNYAWQVFTDNP